MRLTLLLMITATLASGCVVRARPHPHRPFWRHRVEAPECVDCATLEAVPRTIDAAPAALP